MTEIEKLQVELKQRDTSVHELHQLRASDQKRLEATQRDLEEFVHWLQQAEDERDRLKRRQATPFLTTVREAVLGKEKKAPPAGFPPAPFVYYIRTSPFRVFREPSFMLAGWAFPQDGQAVTALRARVDDASFSGTYGLAEPEVIAQHGEQPENPRPGFKILIEIPPGRHRLSLEARLGAGDWVTIISLPIWARFPTR